MFFISLSKFAVLSQLCAYSLSAYITLPSTTLETFYRLTNISTPINSTNTSYSPTLHQRPPTETYTIPISSTLNVTVSNYGRPISEESMYPLLLHANEAVVAALQAKGTDAVIDHYLNYATEDAALKVVPAPLMGWGVWGESLGALGDFLEGWEMMELVFIVSEGGRDVGIGYFARR